MLSESSIAGLSTPSLIAFAVTFGSIKILFPNAARLGLVDHPDGQRKLHSDSKPVVGGLGMLAGIMPALLLFSERSISRIGFLAALLIVMVTGAVDDRRHLGFKFRFMLQALATLLVLATGGHPLQSFGDLFGLGQIQTGVAAWSLTIICIVGVVNAVNMIDGLDGLAGSISFIAFVAYGLLAAVSGRPDLQLLCAVFATAIAAFLYFNWNPARLFMGDAGSMGIGFTLAWVAVELTRPGTAISVSPVAVLLVIAVPVADTLVVMLKRIIARKHPFHPDRNHVHHILQAMSFGHRGSVLFIAVLTIASAGIAVSGTLLHIPDAILFDIWVLGFLLYALASYNVKPMHRMVCRLRRKFSASR
ncbi:MAG: hypothetical protein A3K90_08950 [Pelodictyon luteolum]|uniref:Undecaprenyl-phosphate alpha-N-acetylglucosaminyl 1-phosphate transferase n=1 Tax=Pelodictyon luteolum TaxID=1100 RepID=A0A165MB65_PELLU|nr:MraY family glycosyltransferase [Pelodictyon luteolum]KZK75036.1 MAG: hypothetical protein A3K90_08950 [Pelodictyon luteolum]